VQSRTAFVRKRSTKPTCSVDRFTEVGPLRQAWKISQCLTWKNGLDEKALSKRGLNKILYLLSTKRMKQIRSGKDVCLRPRVSFPKRVDFDEIWYWGRRCGVLVCPVWLCCNTHLSLISKSSLANVLVSYRSNINSILQEAQIEF
jgi:hypothetical protein